MSYIPITSFRRPVGCVHLVRSCMAERKLPSSGIDKWGVLREVSAARVAFGLSDRAVTVLQVLLSFHPETALNGHTSDLVVFPSNAAICARLNGMPCSTMRRHLSALVISGLILRRDSPNGKRFKHRGREDAETFGFDLRPLLLRYSEICAEAERTRVQIETLSRLRRTVSLMRRDLVGLVEYGSRLCPELAVWGDLNIQAQHAARILRRVPTLADLEALKADLITALDAAHNGVQSHPTPAKTEELSTNGAVSEQHIQDSITDISDLEEARNPIPANGELAKPYTIASDSTMNDTKDSNEKDPPNVSFDLVLSVCKEVQKYTSDRLRHWRDLIRTSEVLHPMLGITSSAWLEAVEGMGCAQAAVVISAMLERLSEIRSPNGYLRTLARRAQNGTFSCGPMIKALVNRTLT